MTRLGVLLAAVVVTAGCAARHRGAEVTVPEPLSGRVGASAARTEPLGDVDAIAVAVTNGLDHAVRLDARQIYARAGGTRVPPLTPAEAARRAGGRKIPGRVRSGARGAVTGGILGAIGGAISGAIQGGVGLATAAGTAVGVTIGAITGVAGGGGDDVAGFTDRALQDTVLQPTYSATGYVYYPAGAYTELEVLLADEAGGDEVQRLVVPLGAARE